MRLSILQTLKLFRRYLGALSHLTMSLAAVVNRVPYCPQVTATLLQLWKATAYSLLPLLLLYYHYSGFIFFSLVVSSLCGVLYFAQDILLYHANNPENSRVFVQNLTVQNTKHPPGGCETVQILTDDYVMLHGYLLKAQNYSTAPTIVYFHGNAGNVGHRLPNGVEMVLELKCNVLLVDYRGYGLSQGSPSEDGMYLDAKAAVNFVRANSMLNGERIILFGRSLGGAVAVDAASPRNIGFQSQMHAGESTGDHGVSSPASHPSGVVMMIVENTFTHIAEVAEIMFQIPGFSYIPRLLYKNKFASVEKISQVEIASLFVSGQADQLIPPHMMSTLFSRCGATKKRLLKVRGGTHNETWMCSGYYESIRKFIEEVLGPTYHQQQAPPASKQSSGGASMTVVNNANQMMNGSSSSTLSAVATIQAQEFSTTADLDSSRSLNL